MNTITQSQLTDLLSNVKGAAPIGLTVLTEAKTNANPFGSIYKLAKINAFIGANYEKSVNRQLEKSGETPDFKAQSRVWGEREGNLITKDGKNYLAVHVRNSSRPIYMNRTSGGLKMIATEKVIPFLAKSSPNLVGYRNYSLANIRAISLNGEKFKILS